MLYQKCHLLISKFSCNITRIPNRPQMWPSERKIRKSQHQKASLRASEEKIFLTIRLAVKGRQSLCFTYFDKQSSRLYQVWWYKNTCGVFIGMYLLYSDGVYIYSNALTHIASYKLYIRHSDFESRVTFIRPFPINPSDRDMCYVHDNLNELSRIYYGM